MTRASLNKFSEVAFNAAAEYFRPFVKFISFFEPEKKKKEKNVYNSKRKIDSRIKYFFASQVEKDANDFLRHLISAYEENLSTMVNPEKPINSESVAEMAKIFGVSEYSAKDLMLNMHPLAHNFISWDLLSLKFPLHSPEDFELHDPKLKRPIDKNTEAGEKLIFEEMVRIQFIGGFPGYFRRKAKENEIKNKR